MDRKLSFRDHVNYWAVKAERLGAHLRFLGNTTRGAPPHAMREAVRACVISMATYGAEAWYPSEKDSKGRLSFRLAIESDKTIAMIPKLAV